MCGNDVVEMDEACDGADLGGEDCLTQGFAGGQLACAESCVLDTSGCLGLVCGAAPNVEPAECPPQCSSCTDDTCIITCIGVQKCVGKLTTCPDGWNCEVLCDGTQSCTNAEYHCPAEHECSLTCVGTQSCTNVKLFCGDGPCALDCQLGTQACVNTAVDCGPNECLATCPDLPNTGKPNLACNASCDCMGC